MSCNATALYPGGQLEALSQKKKIFLLWVIWNVIFFPRSQKVPKYVIVEWKNKRQKSGIGRFSIFIGVQIF